jgi:hypothetical protein
LTLSNLIFSSFNRTLNSLSLDNLTLVERRQAFQPVIPIQEAGWKACRTSLTEKGNTTAKTRAEPQPFGVACARKKNTGKMPVLLRGRARCPAEEHRQDACATAGTGKMPGKRTQARCLCYCGDGQDARQKNTGKMPVLLQGQARCPQ